MFNKGLTYTYTKAETSGIFALEHTFEFSGGKEGETCGIGGKSNLMDYCSPQGTFMAVWQWNLLDNHKDRIIPFLEGDEDAMAGFKKGTHYNWFLDFFKGGYEDPLESQVDDLMKLLDHIYENYDGYFNNTSYDDKKNKSKDSDVTLKNFTNWSVRGYAHKGTICKNIYQKILSEKEETISLFEKGIFLESYSMNLESGTKKYKVAVYSNKGKFVVNQSIIKRDIKDIDDIADSKKIKVACNDKYGILAFYGDDGELQMIIQIWNANLPSPQEDALSWLNYLAIVVDDEKGFLDNLGDAIAENVKQTGEKVNNTIKSISQYVKELYSSIELPRLWGDENNEDDKIDNQNNKERYIINNSQANKRGEDGTIIQGDFIPLCTEVEVDDFVTKNVNGKDVLCAKVEILGKNPKEVYLTSASNLTKIEVYDNPEKRELKRTIKSVDLPFDTKEKNEFKESKECYVLAKCGNYFRISGSKEVSWNVSNGDWVKQGAFQEVGGTIDCLIDEKYFFKQRPGDCYNSCVDIVKDANGGVYNTPGRWALANLDANGDELLHMDCYAEAIMALDASLEEGIPVIVGLDWKKPNSPYNFDKVTDHWVIIVGRGVDDDGVYYTYFEVAQSNENGEKKGTSGEYNRFYKTSEGYLQGKNKTMNSGSSRFPIITVIEAKETECCCTRNYFEGWDKKCECEQYNNRRNDGKEIRAKGNLIKFR